MQKSQKEINSNLMIAIYKNLQTAKQSINNVIDKIKDTRLKKELKEQFKDYDRLSESCEDLAKVHEIELKDNNFFEKARMWLSVNMATMLDKSNRKISSINIVGSTMGVIDLMSVLSDCKKGKKELLNLGKEVLELEEKNIEKLKPYILIDSKKENQEKEAKIELGSTQEYKENGVLENQDSKINKTDNKQNSQNN